MEEANREDLVLVGMQLQPWCHASQSGTAVVSCQQQSVRANNSLKA